MVHIDVTNLLAESSASILSFSEYKPKRTSNGWRRNAARPTPVSAKGEGRQDSFTKEPAKAAPRPPRKESADPSKLVPSLNVYIKGKPREISDINRFVEQYKEGDSVAVKKK